MVLCGVAISLPFLVVTLPPITDLPQQTAQIRLLVEAWGDPQSPYQIQAWHPNKLGYAPIALAWALAGPLAAGRLGMLLIGLAWVVALHLLARATDRPPAAAILAALFFFNHLMYWGFLNFLIGLPVFIAWFVALARLPRSTMPLRLGWWLLGLSFLLYSAHVLWLAVGVGWLLLDAAVQRLPIKVVLGRLLWTLPAVLVVAWWYPRLSQGGFDSEIFWGNSAFERLHPSWWLSSAFGGLEGSVETGVAVAVLLWLGLGLWQHRGELRRAAHPSLLAAGLMFFAAAMFLPGVVQHTIFFASRFVPMAVVFLVLALPGPRLGRAFETALPSALILALTLTTAITWHLFERQELDGLPAVLESLPTEPRVLGLDLVRTSERIRGFPFYHLYVYGQVVAGGEINRSFANEATSLVVYDDLPRKLPWTEGLDWKPQKLRHSDFAYFDWLIVHGDDEPQAIFFADPQLEPATSTGRWRLYRIR